MINSETTRMTRYVLFTLILTANICQGQLQQNYTLREVVELAMKNDLNVKRSAAAMKIEKVNYSQARTNLLPSLNVEIYHGLNAGRSIDPSTNSFVNQNVNGGNYIAASNLTLFNGGLLRNRIRQGALAFEAGTLEWRQARDELVLNVILTYLSVLNNSDQLELAIRQSETSRSALERLMLLDSAGAVRPSDVSDLRGQLMNDELNIVNARNQLNSSKLLLAQLINVRFDTAMQVERIERDEFFIPYQYELQEIVDSSMKHFSQVMAIESRTKSSEYNVRATKGLLYPRLFIDAGISSRYSSLAENAGVKMTYPDQLKNFKNTFVELGLVIPIFNRSYAKNQLRIAELQLEDQRLLESDTKRQVIQQIDQAFMDMNNAYDRYILLISQVTAYEKSFKAAEVRFKAGVGNSIDYLTVKDRYDRASINLVNAQYEYLLRKRILDYYSGRSQFAR